VSHTADAATILAVGFTLAGILWASPLLVRQVREGA
jgi:hypothetical protein